jgi:nucleotide-binding universal stress UspA family protein
LAFGPTRLSPAEEPGAGRLFSPATEELARRRTEGRVYAGGSVARVLTEVAAEDGSDLIVIGAGHRGALGRTFLGSVAHGLLHGAPAPVVTAPKGYAKRPRHAPDLIAVAYDGTPEAEAALGSAEALALRDGARMRLLAAAVIPATPAGMLGYSPPMPEAPDQVLADGLATLDPRVDAETRLLRDDSIAEAIVADCGEEVGLLVVGSRGYGAFSRVMIGSVAAGLIHQARCPVMVAPRPHREEMSPDWRLREPRRKSVTRSPEAS